MASTDAAHGPAVALAAQDAPGGAVTGPRLSHLATGLLGEADDDGWGLYFRARQLAAEGHDVLNLAVGEHDRLTDPAIVEALVRAAREGPHGYAPLQGRPNLRTAVARRLSRHDPARPVAAEEVHVTVGCQQALMLAMQLALDPGDDCLVLDPYYPTYPQTVRAAGARPVMVATRREDGFQPDPDAIARAITPRTRALVLNTPNNPTGAVYTRDRLEAVAAIARAHDLWVIADEVYDGLVHRGTHVSPRSLPGMAARTLVAGSLSKSFAMTGWRIGWLAGPAPAIARAGDFAVASTYGLAPFLQSAAETALAVGAPVEAAIAAETAERAAAVAAALPPEGPVTLTPADGAMYAMLDISASGLSGRALAARFIEETHVALMPGESFGTAAAGCVRAALVAPAPRLAATARALADLVARLAAARGHPR
ncbi:MAG: aminotransferase class I/II-fold pyridoxal phosphate-dependent enzyme [Pseudomonadota bacterium]